MLGIIKHIKEEIFHKDNKHNHKEGMNNYNGIL